MRTFRQTGRILKISKQPQNTLKKTTGNILITTGSKEIAKFSVIADRAFARVTAVGGIAGAV